LLATPVGSPIAEHFSSRKNGTHRRATHPSSHARGPEQQLVFAARGSAWEIELDHRGILDEAELEIAWVEENSVALVES